MQTVTNFIFLSSKITVDGEYSREIKKRLLLGRKAMKKPRQWIKKQRHHFADKGLYCQSYGLSSNYGRMCESDRKEACQFSSVSQSSPASWSFPGSQFFRWWPKNWSFSISLSNEYSGLISFRIDWIDLLLSKGLLRVFLSTTIQKYQFFGAQPSYHGPTLTSTHDYWKNHSFDYTDLC